ncbi:hypothetical protein BDQ12DRAFT_729967 [Crucibulum laeve]|uniref:Uncharacterized protein n=1 Tax=Crucibulum laeve TaxID=68775 RepID=A0A5C3LDZ0_9AGAR|nr:hypothetical protein BDQ12DRAFT_729967 [Crucibulum laeve]
MLAGMSIVPEVLTAREEDTYRSIQDETEAKCPSKKAELPEQTIIFMRRY